MKKLIITLLVLVLLFLCASWYFIPSTLIVSSSSQIAGNGRAALRKAVEDSAFRRQMVESGSNGINTAVSKFMTHGFEITTQYKDKSYTGHLLIIALGVDSTSVSCDLTVNTGNNPFQKIAGYQTALALKKETDRIVHGLQNNFSVFENLYGFKLDEASTPDSFFITTKTVSPVYPSTNLVYTQIHKLENFCQQQAASITGSPMLNISKPDSTGYIVKTALPVNKRLPVNGDITPGKMVPGRFIVTDVTGGPHSIQRTMQQVQNYFQDYGRTSMAIPFEYLITNREKETDTSKWVTRIYSPVY